MLATTVPNTFFSALFGDKSSIKGDNRESESGTPPVRTILVLSANPKNTERRRFDEEVKKIEQGLDRAKNRKQFNLIQKWAVTDDDLRRALLDYEPEIVHFAGHGSGTSRSRTSRDLIPAGNVESGGLAFEDDAGNAQLISGEALARLIEVCAHHVKCVVLNACYSESQADAIVKHTDYVVGMKEAVGDAAAIKFAVGFYDALGAGRDVEDAFKFGCSAIDLKGIPEYLTPVLKKRRGPVRPPSPSPSYSSPAGNPGDHADKGRTAVAGKRTVLFKGYPVELAGSGVKAGDKAPDFSCVGVGLSVVGLADSIGKARLFNVVPSLDTPVCNKQTRRFNKELRDLVDKAEAYTVSLDLPFAQQRWCTEAKVENFKYLSDVRDHSFGEHYGVLLKGLPIFLLARAVFVIDPAGTVKYAQVVPSIGDEPNYVPALQALREAAGA